MLQPDPVGSRIQAEQCGQAHIFESLDQLSAEDRQTLERDIQVVDFKFLQSIFAASTAEPGDAAAVLPGDVRPVRDVLRLQDGSPEQRSGWRSLGLQLIAQGKAAVLLLAGGQGTRLGSDLPKGCFNVGLPSNMTLFQIQAERLKKVQQLAAEASPSSQGGQDPRPLHWFIMTSPFTHEATVSYFESHSYFGLLRDQVHFFQQGFLPCLTEQGKVIMESSCTLAKAPDGNGGVYMALHSSGCLDLMAESGIECLDVCSVDNILARLGDPLFIGYCYDRGAQVGARVVSKAYPEEKVGVCARRGELLAVLEYCELDPAVASALDPSSEGDQGQLLYNWANICMHYFSTAWLRKMGTWKHWSESPLPPPCILLAFWPNDAELVVCSSLQDGRSPYHVARKKIMSKDGLVDGIKLELFIFDTFPLADPGKSALMQVDRAQEFAPVKNARGSAVDSPDTARAAVLALHRSWVEAAGGTVGNAEGIEVAPRLSYAGEGLRPLCAGREFGEREMLLA